MLLFKRFYSADTGTDPSLIHTVKRGDLHVTVTERADVRAAWDLIRAEANHVA